MHESRGKLHRTPLPLGFFVALALVVVFERYEARNPTTFPSNGGCSWHYMATQLKSKVAGREVLCFGASFINFGVVPAVLHERTGKSAYNASVHSGSAVSSYYLFQRAVSAGARPKAVLVEFYWEILLEGPASEKRPYPWADLLTLGETLELSWMSRDTELLTGIVANRLLPSRKNRYEVRDKVVKALRGELDVTAVKTMSAWRNWNQNQGALLLAKNPRFREGPVPLSPRTRAPSDWRADPTNAAYVRKFLDLAARINARVYWLLPPVSPWTQYVNDSKADEWLYENYVRDLQGRYPNVIVIDGRRAGFGADVFSDGVHLDQDGAFALSEGIGEVMRSTWDGVRPSSRWLPLPPYAPACSRVSFEGFAASMQWVIPHSANALLRTVIDSF